jgi:hypothetical protein
MSAHLPAGGGPFSFSIFRTVSRSSRNSAGFAPITCCAMIEDDACPSAQALTSWAKSLTAPSLTFRSTVTVDPQSFECAVAGRVGRGEPAQTGDVARQVEDSGVINVVKHR